MKFEYKTLRVAKDVLIQSKKDTTVNLAKPEDFEQALNDMGSDGWELIQIVDPKGFLGLGDVGYCVFKREVEGE